MGRELRFSMRMDDISSKGSAQGKESVADEQDAQAHLSRAPPIACLGGALYTQASASFGLIYCGA